jgi:MSHA biogenesis protein MshM
MSSVYLQRFRLERQPFALLPDADFFFEGERRGTLLHGLQQAVLDDAGLCVVVGEVGTGKTMLCRMLAQQLAHHAVDVAFVPDASLPREALLTSIAADLGLESTGPGGAVVALQQALMARTAHGRRLVLLIDEAHTLKPEALDTVRMLMNVETGQRKLLQIILFGQPELQTLLRRPDLRQVRDRIAHQFQLEALTQAGAQAYLEHRLRQAGWRGDDLLEPGAMRALVRHAAGRFRALGLLADKALLAAYSEGARQVGAPHVQRAWRELALSRAGSWRWQAWPTALAARLLPATGNGPRTGLAMAGAAGVGVVAVFMASLAADPLGTPLRAWQSPAVAATAAKPVAETARQRPNYEALLAAAPPAALQPREATYFTLQLASLPTEAIALAEAERLSKVTGLKDLFVLHRPGPEGSKSASPAPWVVCSGRYADTGPLHKAQASLPRGISRPRVLKVES